MKRMDVPNNRQNTIPTIPAININILIDQQANALADGIINNKGAPTERKKHIMRIGQTYL